MDIRIQYASAPYFSRLREALQVVAAERVYLEMVEAPPLDTVSRFQADLIEKNGPSYYAIEGERVVGWCDIFPHKNPRQSHRGGLGMGLLPAYRGKGLGAKLLDATVTHAAKFGLEKVELHVYTTNEPAIALYRKFGFTDEGVIRHYRKVDGLYFDALAMAKFVQPS